MYRLSPFHIAARVSQVENAFVVKFILGVSALKLFLHNAFMGMNKASGKRKVLVKNNKVQPRGIQESGDHPKPTFSRSYASSVKMLFEAF